jgi:hypothetical protein
MGPPSPALGDPQPLILSPGRVAMAARVTEPAGLPAALRVLGLSRPGPVLVLVGGAAGLDPGLGPALTALFRALVPVLRAAGAVVLDGGTRAGVMALMGEAAAETGIALLGVAAIGTVRLPQTGPSGAAPAGGADHRADLDPGHDRFLLVPGQDWGDESPWLAAAAAVLAGGLPSLTLVAGGGAVTARDLLQGLRLGRPALVLAGTGGIADALAAHLRAGDPPPFDLPSGATGGIEVMDLERAVLDLPPLLRRALGG